MRNYFLLCIALFTGRSAMCGFATSLGQMIVFRIIQGLAGGGLQPCSQGVLLDAFPEEKQGTAMTLFGVAAILGPIVGPTLGGWLCVNYNWRFIFLINVPIGVFSLIAAYLVVEDPEYLKRERAEVTRGPLNFDYIGLSLLVLAMCCWEIMLSKGQEWDWLGDPFGRVQTLLILFVLGTGWLIYHEMRTASPIINFRVLRDRNLSLSCIIMFSAFAVLYCSCIALPGLLQSLLGYDGALFRAVDVPLGRVVHGGNDRGRGAVGVVSGRPLVSRQWIGRDDDRQLCPIANESGDWAVAGDLAAHAADAGHRVSIRPDQRGCI